jgi:hypothetical protein
MLLRVLRCVAVIDSGWKGTETKYRGLSTALRFGRDDVLFRAGAASVEMTWVSGA